MIRSTSFLLWNLLRFEAAQLTIIEAFYGGGSLVGWVGEVES